MKKTLKAGSRPSDWPPRVLALIKSGNTSAAIEQIKVAPTVKDLLQLQKVLAGAQLPNVSAQVSEAIHDGVVAMSSPRLHRSP